jgi:hypothetical protein
VTSRIEQIAVVRKKFAVVEFSDGSNQSSSSLVSSSWINDEGDHCYWPPNGDIKKLAAKHANVGDKCTLRPCRVIGQSGMQV